MSDFTVDVELETDGRWIGEVTELPGVMVYGSTRDEAVAKTKALAFRVQHLHAEAYVVADDRPQRSRP